MSIQISDCTIRDGGYLLAKNSDPEFVKGVIEGLTAAGIDYIETGFLQDVVMGESIVYENSKGARRYIPDDRRRSEFVGFCDNSRYSNRNLDLCDGSSFTNLRISFAKHECDDALRFCAEAKAKGYHVFVQPMDAVGYSSKEREQLIKTVNEFQPEALAIVDTFGAMYMEDLESIFRQMDKYLDKNVKIGLHTHNNLQLSSALAERLIAMAAETDRSVAVDGSLLGMGRGAGNAHTEIVADYINKYYGGHYDMELLLETIERYVAPLKATVQWGYDIPMFICGTEGAHVDNVEYLKKHTDCNWVDILRVIDRLDKDKRKRYGKGYSKTDFSLIAEEYRRLRNHE
ncbi:hypothetical protein [Lachnoclostridium sp. Marseille-P6806]|uniref:hypothetical protein n=1 Tax=Lachnoclostridium sp. Marseille-P6806 TaxID=2364793 RepID=UPI0010304183|nr:hypothetical protein [Lachnoclostridium sp. Marseille-P6806]